MKPTPTTSSLTSERAKARWAILRSALLTNKQKNKGKHEQSKDENINLVHNSRNYSINRFAGFQLLKRRAIPLPMVAEGTLGDSSINGGSINGIKNIGSNEEGKMFDYFEYRIEMSSISTESKSNPTALWIRTRERRIDQDAKINIHELMSHVHYGVDNTGNTRVWDSASTLTYIIFSSSFSGASPNFTCTSSIIRGLSSSCSLKNISCFSNTPPIGLKKIFALSQCDSDLGYTKTKKRLKIVELGAGMAGLAALALAALGEMANLSLSDLETAQTLPPPENEEKDVPIIEVTITDGHPDAVKNNEVCAALTSTICRDSKTRTMDSMTCTTPEMKPYVSIQSRRLLWKSTKEGAEECQTLLKTLVRCRGDNTAIPFDLSLVSDCTHFVEFHDALIATIGRVLRVGGICIMCQPCRGKSLQMFVEMVQAVNGNRKENEKSNTDRVECAHGALFDLKLYDQYDDTILRIHSEQLALNARQGDCYDPDIHYPILLIMEKLREYDEEIDTRAALDHLRTRNQH